MRRAVPFFTRCCRMRAILPERAHAGQGAAAPTTHGVAGHAHQRQLAWPVSLSFI